MTQDAKPLTTEEVEERRAIVAESLKHWNACEPATSLATTTKRQALERYGVELRLLATIDKQAAEIARLTSDHCRSCCYLQSLCSEHDGHTERERFGKERG